MENFLSDKKWKAKKPNNRKLKKWLRDPKKAKHNKEKKIKHSNVYCLENIVFRFCHLESINSKKYKFGNIQLQKFLFFVYYIEHTW